MSALLIVLFGFQIQAALTGFADIATFLEVITILPALVLVFVYSVLGLKLVWRKGSMTKPGKMIPLSSVLAILTLGFVLGSVFVGVLASGAVLAIGRSSNVSADITIVVGAANSGTAQPFSPANFTVKAGTTVTWVNKDPVTHTVTSTSVPIGAILFDSGNLPYGNTFSVKLTVPGVYHYFCSIHPSMQGTIQVTA
jgi:plastocyanin